MGSRCPRAAYGRLRRRPCARRGSRERLTTHSFRHSAVTFALLGGASLQQAQALARHTNLTTTMVYAHNVDRVSQAPERFVDGLLDD